MKTLVRIWDFLQWEDGRRLIRVSVYALLIASFGFVGFVPSESMQPTLQERDVVVGFKVFNDFERGDVVRFQRNGSYHVKRIAGIPGDRIAVSGETVVVNGQGFGVSGLEELTLGADEYYVTGDNAENSFDSRYYGPIKKSQLVGIARVVISPLHRIGAVR